MKKQKFSPYEEPIFHKPMLPSRNNNRTSASVKNCTPKIKNSQSLHKTPDLPIFPKFQLYDEHKLTLPDQERSYTCQMRDKSFKAKLPIQIFLEKEFQPIIDHTSLRKIHAMELDDQKIRSSQGRKTLNNQTSKTISKKVHTSALLSLKDAKIIRMKNFTASPYLKNVSDVSKIVKMLKPVKGPNESIKKQIMQHNEENKKNHQLVVLRRANQTFGSKRQMYLERIGLKPDSKVFVMNSRDFHIREALLRRGWIQLHDISDSFFHLKWVYSDSSNDYVNLQKSQLFNHFHNNQELTNKNNLRKNIKSASISDRPQIPLTFDFGIANEFKKFVESATLFQGVKILNLIKNTFQEEDPYDYERIVSNPNYFKFHNKNSFVKTARKKQKFKFYELLGIKNGQDDENLYILVERCMDLMIFLVKEIEKQISIEYSIFKSSDKDKKPENILSVFEYFQTLKKIPDMVNLLLKIPRFIKIELIKMYFHFQDFQNIYRTSYGNQNSWIIKPTGVSRGSGIYIESDYKKLMTQTNNQHGKIVQKYIQRPFLLADHRKFDLRQWVLVKSFQPLEVYIYQNLYGRICPQKYADTDFQNIQKHLTNYSLSKQHYRARNGGSGFNIPHSEDFSVLFNHVGMKKIPTSSVILQEDLKRQIEGSNPKKKSWAQIKFEIKKNIIKTLKVCSCGIVQSPNCFEMYGFDILLDENLNVFVIEVNLSPACEKRQGLQMYLEQMSDELVVMVEKWLNLPSNNEENLFNKAWEKLDEKVINRELDKIKKRKVKEEKAKIIQKWVRSNLLKYK